MKQFRHAIVLTLVATAMCADTALATRADAARDEVFSSPTLIERVKQSFAPADRPVRLYPSARDEQAVHQPVRVRDGDQNILPPRPLGAYFFRTPPPAAFL